MSEYRKFSDDFKNEDQGCIPAKEAKPAKVSPALASFAALATVTRDILQDFWDAVDERAGIMQHDALDVHRTRAEAEAAALEDTKDRFHRKEQ